MSGNAQALLEKYGITIPPSRGEAGADGGCLFVGRWEGEDYRFIVPFMTVSAPRCCTKKLKQEIASEWRRAVTGSERFQYLCQLPDYSGRIGATGAVGPITSDADTPAGVADDIVAWACERMSLALDENNIPKESRDEAKYGPIIPHGFTARALRPPDSKPYIELADQSLRIQEWSEWEDRWEPLIAAVLSSAVGGLPLFESGEKYRVVAKELNRIRGDSKQADDPDAWTEAELRKLAGEKKKPVPVSPDAEDKFVPANAPLSEKPFGEAAQAIEEARQDMEDAEQAESKPTQTGVDLSGLSDKEQDKMENHEEVPPQNKHKNGKEYIALSLSPEVDTRTPEEFYGDITTATLPEGETYAVQSANFDKQDRQSQQYPFSWDLMRGLANGDPKAKDRLELLVTSGLLSSNVARELSQYSRRSRTDDTDMLQRVEIAHSETAIDGIIENIEGTKDKKALHAWLTAELMLIKLNRDTKNSNPDIPADESKGARYTRVALTHGTEFARDLYELNKWRKQYDAEVDVMRKKNKYPLDPQDSTKLEEMRQEDKRRKDAFLDKYSFENQFSQAFLDEQRGIAQGWQNKLNAAKDILSSDMDNIDKTNDPKVRNELLLAWYRKLADTAEMPIRQNNITLGNQKRIGEVWGGKKMIMSTSLHYNSNGTIDFNSLMIVFFHEQGHGLQNEIAKRNTPDGALLRHNQEYRYKATGPGDEANSLTPLESHAVFMQKFGEGLVTGWRNNTNK